jgi:hypothetical protein
LIIAFLWAKPLRAQAESWKQNAKDWQAEAERLGTHYKDMEAAFYLLAKMYHAIRQGEDIAQLVQAASRDELAWVYDVLSWTKPSETVVYRRAIANNSETRPPSTTPDNRAE